MRKCTLCDKEATVAFGADPDMRGVPSCDEHKDEIRMALIMAQTYEEFEQIIKSFKNKIKKNVKSKNLR